MRARGEPCLGHQGVFGPAAADERERVPGNCSVLHFAFDDATDTFELVEVFTQEDYARELGLEPLVAAAGPQRG